MAFGSVSRSEVMKHRTAIALPEKYHFSQEISKENSGKNTAALRQILLAISRYKRIKFFGTRQIWK